MTYRDSLAVIVVNWNSGRNLKRCVESLLAQVSRPRRIIIVDNASEDDSLASLDSLDCAVEIHRMERNLGFAAANNFALGLASDCAWVALLNPDAFAAPDWLAQLLEAARSHPEFTFFASRMLSDAAPTLLDGAGDVYHFTGLAWRRGHGRSAGARYLQWDEVFSACAGAALYHRDALLDIGGFDESFFCYVEDVDLGFRLRLRGHRCMYVPVAVVHHVGSASTGKDSDLSVYYGHRNLIWAFFKNMPALLLAAFLMPHLVANVCAIMKHVMHGQGRIAFYAKLDAMKNLRHVFEQRKHVQKARTVSAWRIAKMLNYRL
ncbi:MAG TPA: glycosyltransferase family 2 protein [Gammaproteobacteria bacterium]|nr:glycosyltransferase family 2 protein [Gammaproteobacteria bacterium]